VKSDVPSLREVNLALKKSDREPSDIVPVFAQQPDTPPDTDGPVFSQGAFRPRTHIKVDFFSVSGNRESPKFLFNALVHELPDRGQLFNIDGVLYEVKNLTRNMSFVGLRNKIAKEFVPHILVAPYMAAPERFQRQPYRGHVKPSYGNVR